MLASPVSFHLSPEASTTGESFEDINYADDEEDGTSVMSAGLSSYDKILLDLALKGVLHLKHTKMKEKSKTLSSKQEKWLKILVDGPEKEKAIKTAEERGIRHVQSFVGDAIDEKLWQATKELKNKKEEEKPLKQRLVALFKKFYHWVVDSKHKKRSRLKPTINFRQEWEDATVLVNGKVSVLKPGSKHVAWRAGFAYLFDCGWLVCFKQAKHFKRRSKAVYAISLSSSRLSFVTQPLDHLLASRKKFLLRVEDVKSGAVLFLSTHHASSRDVWYNKALEVRRRLQAEEESKQKAATDQKKVESDSEEEEEEETNLQHLLRMQADPNCTGPHGLTPLHLAPKNGNTK